MQTPSYTNEPRVRLRRTWPQRFVIVAGMTLVVLSLASAWGLAEVYNSVGEIERYVVAPDLLEDAGDPGGPRNVLLIGSTEIDGLEGDDAILSGRGNERLADTIMILRIDPGSREAAVMSINRDVYIPNVAGYAGKINGAYQVGNVDLLLRVVQDYLQIPIHNFAIVNFAGFRQLVDELDGVPVYFPYDARDEGSFFSIEAGCRVLDGEAALNYVRSRKYEQYIDGRWRRDPLSDYTRAERQRDFLILTMERAIDRGVRNPNELRRMARAVIDGGAVVIDNELTIDDIVRIGAAFGDFDPETLQRWALPTDPIPGKSDLRMDEVEARPYLDYFRGLGYTFTNTDVRVRVTDARSKALRDADDLRPDAALQEKGIVVTSFNRASSADEQDRTVITYSADQAPAALLLARNLGARPQVEPVSGLNVLTLTVGADWAGTSPELLPEEAVAGALPTAPSTTVAPGSTTTAAPSTEAPTTTVSGGIIGKPPEGVSCE